MKFSSNKLIVITLTKFLKRFSQDEKDFLWTSQKRITGFFESANIKFNVSFRVNQVYATFF